MAQHPIKGAPPIKNPGITDGSQLAAMQHPRPESRPAARLRRNTNLRSQVPNQSAQHRDEVDSQTKVRDAHVMPRRLPIATRYSPLR